MKIFFIVRPNCNLKDCKAAPLSFGLTDTTFKTTQLFPSPNEKKIVLQDPYRYLGSVTNPTFQKRIKNKNWLDAYDKSVRNISLNCKKNSPSKITLQQCTLASLICWLVAPLSSFLGVMMRWLLQFQHLRLLIVHTVSIS